MRADNTDELKDIPSMAVSREDIRGSQRPAARTPSKPAKGSPLLMVVVMILVLALGAVTFFGYQQTQALRAELESNQQAFELTLQRLQDVSGKVIATGESIDQSDTKVQAELKEINSEIRKLWDVSNKRNKRNIEDNAAMVEKLSTSLTSLEKAGKALDQGLKSQQQELLSEKARVSGLATQVQLASTEQAARLESVQERLDSMATLAARVDLLQKQLSADIEAVSGRVQGNAEAVRSIDAFRRQVNGQLLELRDSLNRLQGGSASLATPPNAG
ncbi:hypothetical protein [Aestuariirhabdus litorea]|uniref:Uncharacterized protein n=1 Tax=Aestuariirhabdus litorea TaxID=2528527 RepID=A0A3P3VMA8_9GAMM|nr:hypothetical protein [Aestuariirhabdus litorea]RRJ83901.1 hypothetical protein D0544_01920 [Aestuariirhabdus litorea]RWW97124.1 hypothetical protein DZC74_01925 [Endozoicomonadaceae bacterium GTF-13]